MLEQIRKYLQNHRWARRMYLVVAVIPCVAFEMSRHLVETLGDAKREFVEFW